MGSFDTTLAEGADPAAVAGEPTEIGHWIGGQVAAPSAGRRSPVFNRHGGRSGRVALASTGGRRCGERRGEGVPGGRPRRRCAAYA